MNKQTDLKGHHNFPYFFQFIHIADIDILSWILVSRTTQCPFKDQNVCFHHVISEHAGNE